MNTSLSKGQIQFIKELHQKEGRNLHGLFIVEGEKMVDELLALGLQVHSVYHTAEYSQSSLIPANYFTQISNKELDRISCLITPNKVLAIAHLPNNAPITSDKVIYCSNLQDPGNAGTILRTADWFGIKDVVFTLNSVDVFSPKAVQASMGSVFRMNCIYDNAIFEKLEDLKKEGYCIYAADMVGININEIHFKSKSVIILGSESHGIETNIKPMIDEFIHIPKIGNAESLNVGVACGIICHKLNFN